MAELRGALYDRLLDAAAVRREIERAIASLGEERLRLLLEYRYIDGLTLEAGRGADALQLAAGCESAQASVVGT